MVANVRILLNLLLVLPVAVFADDLGHSPPTLCSLLESIRPGEQREVEVSGVFGGSLEYQYLYEPRTPLCSLDVQPVTWVDFADDVRYEPAFRKSGASRRYVTFRGVLHGPGIVEEDDLSLPLIGSYANRTAFDRYGHMGGFRTKLVVREVVEFSPVPEDIVHPVFVGRPEIASPPRVQAGTLPQYPENARRAGIEGMVEMKVVVEGGEMKSVDRISGDRILALASRAAIETWSFDSAYSGTFVSTFHYRLELRSLGANPNPTIVMQLPTSVRLTAPGDGW